jgi:hypothetical protein
MMIVRLLGATALACALAVPVSATDAMPTGFAFAIGPNSNAEGRCVIAIGEGVSVRGSNLIKIGDTPPQPVYKITPEIRDLMDTEISRMEKNDPDIWAQRKIIPSMLDKAVQAFNHNCQ